MQTIYKYPIIFGDTVRVNMPFDSKILKIAKQNDFWYLWALVNPDEVEVVRNIHIYGTGQLVPESAGKFITTVLDDNFVWHFFDNGESGL